MGDHCEISAFPACPPRQACFIANVTARQDYADWVSRESTFSPATTKHGICCYVQLPPQHTTPHRPQFGYVVRKGYGEEESPRCFCNTFWGYQQEFGENGHWDPECNGELNAEAIAAVVLACIVLVLYVSLSVATGLTLRMAISNGGPAHPGGGAAGSSEIATPGGVPTKPHGSSQRMGKPSNPLVRHCDNSKV